MPQDKHVITEGCDCYGEANNVKDDGDYVCIYRHVEYTVARESSEEIDARLKAENPLLR